MTAHQAISIFPWEVKTGDLVEVRDADHQQWTKAKFIGCSLSRNGSILYYVSPLWDEPGENWVFWSQCRIFESKTDENEST
jgi:hypothetical protein